MKDPRKMETSSGGSFYTQKDSSEKTDLSFYNFIQFLVKSEEFLRDLISRDREGSSALARKVHSLA